MDLNNIIDSVNETDIYRTCYPTVTDYTFFSIALETFSRINHMLGHKKSLRKFRKQILDISKRWKSYQISFWLQEINQRRKTWKLMNMWILNNTLKSKQWIKESVRRELKSILRQVKWKSKAKLMQCSKSSSKG